ncbi:hypothetical protein F5B20DRAFT_524021 [Whalleya microplaca]|nr:hypothetical protein F5B20DRAFT_524021 [Whalleya microplaca]
MLPTVIKTCPSADNDFQPLSEYEAQTPDTFFDGKPILYYHDENIKAWVSTEQHKHLHFFSHDSDGNAVLPPSPPECYALENSWGQHLCEEERVEVFVASNKLILFSHNSSTGIEIPYPAISLHAIKNFRHLEKPDDPTFKFIGVYMQLELSDAGAEDDESFDPVELTLVPHKGMPLGNPAQEGPTIDLLNAERTNALFNQISACSNLHPDPQNEEEDDDDDDGFDRIIFEGGVEQEALDGLPGVMRGDSSGGLPPPMPGSSGWITADNVHEFFDEDGNWIEEGGVSGELGDGAGRVRARNEVDEEKNGLEDGDDSESKRARTE